MEHSLIATACATTRAISFRRGRRGRRVALPVLLASFVAAAALVACGGGTTDPAPGATAPPPAPGVTPVLPAPLAISIVSDDRAAAGVINRYTAVDANASTFTASWTVDGANLGAGNPLQEIWSRPGEHKVAVTATASDSRSATAQRTVNVVSQPIVAGAYHSCALTPTGQVSCWGANDYQQLGDGSSTQRSTPTAVPGLTGMRGLAAGERHTCAITASYSVVCWGWNDYAQLGDGSTRSSANPVAVRDLTDVIALAAGSVHTCALRLNNTVACWGLNSDFQIDSGQGTLRTTPVTVAGLADVVAISAGAKFNCALQRAGTVWCWGSNASGELGRGTASVAEAAPARAAGLTDVVALAAGANNVCALKANGSVACWGENSNNQQGNGLGSNDVLTPAALAGVSDVVALSAGTLSACATERTGAVKCWGRNLWGEGGDATDNSIATPTLVPSLGRLAYLAEGARHACGLRADGSAWCKGEGYEGELGNGQSGGTAGSRVAVPVTGGASWWRP
jgi:alpha-tubulin suppressor-like RCC1 family protein